MFPQCLCTYVTVWFPLTCKYPIYGQPIFSKSFFSQIFLAFHETAVGYTHVGKVMLYEFQLLEYI